MTTENSCRSPLLEVQHLHVSYGNVEALHGASLMLFPGEIVSVIGANGAGKTTMLSAIMGLLPGVGLVRLDQEDISRCPVEQRVARGLTLVPEKRELFLSMSVEDNLILGAYRPYIQGERDYRETMAGVVARFPRLSERRRQLAGTLSGGERAMLVIARALMSKPKVLLLDEPSLGLSPLNAKEIFGVIAYLKEMGTAIVLVEQNARAALQISARAYVMESGNIIFDGWSDQLVEDRRIQDAYLGKYNKLAEGAASSTPTSRSSRE